MDPYGPPFKKPRSDIFPNGSASYPRLPGFNDFSGRLRPTDGFGAERETLSTTLGSKPKACLKYFSTSGCPYGEGCRFTHNVPGGVSALGLEQSSSLSTLAGGIRKSITGPTASLNPFEQSTVSSGTKSRMCNFFGTAEGCRFGDKCNFAHGERELKKPNVSFPERGYDKLAMFDRGSTGILESRLGGFRGQREPSPPGIGAAASFGASSTAKVPIDATLAGAIIGKGGMHTKKICRVTGAKLSIRDHDSDPMLKNIEMEGSFDQIQQATVMVRELLLTLNIPIPPAKPAVTGPQNLKTKLCENFTKGTCTFGERCHFAHGPNELRQNTAHT